ncbi:MAG: hypothetical protein DCF19_23405 [Pseudanabaena frigida]|uniref:Uncharacterized protein n=1 Tax=Pseudanabaena frigida TaxID=945775 RepID=A0A2W4VUN7_9CYAN|nr:MAG: hypothetical protein DCF19_23405 [Pseudanabaena frigida]
MGISANAMLNFSISANAQSFPNDSVVPASSGSTQYLVYLPNVANIKQAKILAPDAFVSRLDTGEQVVQLGRFNNLNLAQRRAAQFSQAGLAPQIRTVQSKFATFPSTTNSTIPSIPTSNPVPSSSAPVPVESIPIQTSRTNDALPGVPGSEFPNNQNNAIEIVRSPQPIPQQSQPIPTQTNPQPIPQSASQNVSSTSQLRYFVIIPTGSVSELQRVQSIAPNAQLRSSYRGTYIEVQGYPDRSSAETLNLTIRRQGFDSRVVFF